MPTKVPPPGPTAPEPDAAVPAESPVAVDDPVVPPRDATVQPAAPTGATAEENLADAPLASHAGSDRAVPAPSDRAPSDQAADAPVDGSSAPVVTAEGPDDAPATPALATPAPLAPAPARPAPAGTATDPAPTPTRPPLAPPSTRAELRRSRRRPGRSLVHRAIVWAVILGVLAVLAGAGVLAHRRLYAAPPRATVALSVDPAGPVVAPGAEAAAAAPLPWPATGQGAVAIPAVGYSAQSGPEQPVPVASMTKIMTGYLILRDHPLAPGDNGPAIAITPADVANYDQDTVTDQANVPLQAGEVLTERQLLEGLLIHSANDFADTLAAWDAGNVDAFVGKMNLTASQLGMAQTHYVDPSGYQPQSQSTASDLLKVAAVALQDPTFASIVTMSSVSLPLGGVEGSYTPLLPGEPGANPAVVGVKSGFTNAAGGGDVLALKQVVGGHQVLVLAAVTGQETADVLTAAGLAAFVVAQAAGARMVATPTPPIGTVVGTAQVLGTSVPAVTTGSGSLVAWPGNRVQQSATTLAHPPAGAPAGTALGYVTYSIGTQRLAVLVRTTSALPVPSVTQRLF